MGYCREHHSDSRTELLLIRGQLERKAFAQAMWVGLYFIPGGWLWVDRRPLDYEAWLNDKRPQCRKVGMECAAFNVTEQNVD